MTTFYHQGQFWIIEAISGRYIETFSPFATWQEARDAIGDEWDNGDALYPDYDL